MRYDEAQQNNLPWAILSYGHTVDLAGTSVDIANCCFDYALQARILLEEAGAAVREAEGPGGLGPMSGTETGVYVGCMYQEYTDVLAAAGGKLSAATATGNSLSFLVGRVSYTFGLQVHCFNPVSATLL